MTRSGVEESERRESSAFKFRRLLSKAGLSKKILSRRLDHLRAFTRNQASRKGCNTCAWFKLWQIRLRSNAKSESRVSAVRELLYFDGNGYHDSVPHSVNELFVCRHN